MQPETWEQRARRLDRFHRRGLRWLIVGALALLAAGVVLIIWDGSGLTHRCIRIVDAWDLTGDCPKPKTQDRAPTSGALTPRPPAMTRILATDIGKVSVSSKSETLSVVGYASTAGPFAPTGRLSAGIASGSQFITRPRRTDLTHE